MPKAKFDSEFEVVSVGLAPGGSLEVCFRTLLLVESCFFPNFELCALVPASVTVRVGEWAVGESALESEDSE